MQTEPIITCIDNYSCSRYPVTSVLPPTLVNILISDMRIITGTAKGHRIKFPKGTSTRPATDLVRGAIFSIVENIADSWAHVLDLFSGSGALGIEALSRGAGWVDFVEKEPRCCGIIRENLEKTRLSDRAHVYCCNVYKALSFLDKEYDVILMDPPYADASIGDFITQLANSMLIGNKSTVVVTHSPHFILQPHYAGLYMIKEQRHGDSCISIYQKEAVS
jgi:16S rRNA (guanine966-N2)-methyltransferase